MAIANSAAFVAPALPIANVPTGIPPGICTVESSESSPLRALVIGTPRTGNVVCAAMTPAKCARATSGGNDDFDTARVRLGREVAGQARCAVGRHDMRFVRDPEICQGVSGGTHRVPIGFAAHENSDE